MRPREIGQIELLLLATIARSPSHGYAIIARLREATDALINIHEGQAYPALHRLERVGAIASDWEVVNGRRRKIYRIEPNGQLLLEKERRSWEAHTTAVRRALGMST